MRLNILACALTIFLQPIYATVQVTGLQDFNFGTITVPFSDQVLEHSFCVCRQSALGMANQYNVTVTSSHENSGQFFMSNGSDTLKYTVSWDDTLTGGYTVLDSGVESTGYTTARTTIVLIGNCAICPSGNTARMQLTISENSLTTAKSGNYSDTLTILISQP